MEEQKRQLNLKKYITFLVVCAVIVVYVIYIVYRLIASPADTFIVENGKLSSEENVNGYIIREETVLKGENYKNGIYQIKSEGEKVAKGEAVFRYYTTGEEDIKKKIQELDIKIQEAWENENSIFSSDIKILEGQIEEKLNGLYHMNDLQKINEYKKDINSYITKKARIAGEKSPAGSYLKQLIDERSGYENELNQGSEYLKTETSGVVSYRVDGYEEQLSASDFGYLSKSMLEDLKVKTGQVVATSDESAKIVNNFYCYVACVLKHKNVEERKCEIGTRLTVRLQNAEEVRAEIKYISKESDDEDLVVFRIESFVEELIDYRKISMDIIWWNETGLRVPNDAIKKEKDDLYYVIRKRVGYTDKIYVKILKQGEKYSIIENYEDGQELLDKGVSKDEVRSRRTISLYDEIDM